MKPFLLGMYLMALTVPIAAVNAQPISAADAQTPVTLRKAAARQFLIGAAVSSPQLDDAALSPLIAAQFDSLTAENAFKPDQLEREKGVFTWTEADRIADFAQTHKMALIGHCLCWHQQTGQWMYADADGKPLPRAQALANLHDYITAVVTHFKGRVRGWDVVNEAMSDGPGVPSGAGDLRDTPARRAIGDDYIEKAFQFAHEADPNAELYYNDYSIENPDKREKVVRLVRALKKSGCRIDAVGIQGHYSLTWPPPATLDDAIRAYAAEGVKVSFTELDIDVLPRRGQSAEIGTREAGANPYPDACPPDVLLAQAKRYGDLFTVFTRHKGAIERVTIWGVTDGQSWLNNFPVRGRTNYPLLFDRIGKPKPAYHAVIQTLLDPTVVTNRPATAVLSSVASMASVASVASMASVANSATQPPAPTAWTAEQDHQNMMDQLHIAKLRGGADGFNASAPNAQNTDESRATAYTNLPDPLVLNNGKKVTSAKIWWDKRRPEIVEDFDRELYGRVPKATPKVTWEVVSATPEKNGDYAVVTKKLIGHVDNAAYPAITVEIHLTLSTPADASGPVPVLMEFGFPAGFGRPGGFGGGGPRSGGAGQRPNTPAVPAGPVALTWQQQCLARGYGYAVLDPTSFQADNGAGLTRGIIGLCNRGQPRKPDDWGALRAWAWGADRALDYFETDKSVDARQVGIEGLSRYGKAALVTMAYDSRFAVGFIGSSGEGGAKLWRRNFGEQEGNVASGGEYHWMAGNFLKYDSTLTPGDLPVDSHELIALCAPRPTYISCGSPKVEGTWVDDRGMFLGAVYAGPVYRLLGKKDLGTSEMPAIEVGLTDGDLAFRQHSGGHTTGPNWPSFLAFASRYLHAPAIAARPPQTASR